MRYIVESSSLIGGRKENQDAYLVTETRYGLLAIVCDGMGGVNGGKEAAEIGVKAISEEIEDSIEKDPVRTVLEGITEANRCIFNESAKNPWLSGMGTTIIVLLITQRQAWCFHVGDSRIYQFRDGNIIYRTFDHSRVFELVTQGIITEEEARLSPENNIITRVLGTSPDVEVTVSPALDIREGDRFLLCTDGIWGAITEIQLTQLSTREKPLADVTSHMMGYVNELGIIEGGQHDNMTVVFIEATE